MTNLTNLHVYSEQLSDKTAVDDISILLMVVSKLNSSTNLKVVSSDWFGVVVSVTFSSIFATMCFCWLNLYNICNICEFRQQVIVCCQIMSFQQTKGNGNFSKIFCFDGQNIPIFKANFIKLGVKPSKIEKNWRKKFWCFMRHLSV